MTGDAVKHDEGWLGLVARVQVTRAVTASVDESLRKLNLVEI